MKAYADYKIDVAQTISVLDRVQHTAEKEENAASQFSSFPTMFQETSLSGIKTVW